MQEKEILLLQEADRPEPEKKKADLKITGMHCATCAVTVEEALANVKNVTKGTGKLRDLSQPAWSG